MTKRIVRTILVASCGIMILPACGGSDEASPESLEPSISNVESTVGSVAPSTDGYGDCEITASAEQLGEYSLQTIQPGVFEVGTVLPLPGYFNGATPASVHDGYEYCLAAEIAARGGIPTLDIAAVPFDRIVSGNMQGLDMFSAGVYITPEREQVVDFSEPYASVFSGVLVRTDDPVDEQSISTAKIGALTGSLQEQFVRNELKPSAEPQSFQGLAEMYTALLAGTIDVATIDTTTALTQELASDGKLEVVGQYRVGGDHGLIFPKGSPNVVPVNKILDDLMAEGRIKELQDQYLVSVLGRSPDEVPMWAL